MELATFKSDFEPTEIVSVPKHYYYHPRGSAPVHRVSHRFRTTSSLEAVIVYRPEN
jgi:hypothetical protein